MPLLRNLLDLAYENLAQRMSSTRPIGLTTGFSLVDEALGGGLVRQQLSYLVGNSGIGKSWLVSWFMIQAALKLAQDAENIPISGYVLSGENLNDNIKQAVLDKEGKPPIIVFWSLEMAEVPVAFRLISQMSTISEAGTISINSRDLLQGKLGNDPTIMKERLGKVYLEMKENIGDYIYLEFRANNIIQFKEVLNDLTKTYDIVAVFVDYFKLIDQMTPDGVRSSIQEARSNALGEICKDYDCHVMSIFDVNRQGQLADQVHVYHMKDGTAAVYDSDLVITLNLLEGCDGRGSKKQLVFSVEKARWTNTTSVELELTSATGKVESFYSKDAPTRKIVNESTIADE